MILHGVYETGQSDISHFRGFRRFNQTQVAAFFV